jgi:hypothetical protein
LRFFFSPSAGVAAAVFFAGVFLAAFVVLAGVFEAVGCEAGALEAVDTGCVRCV